MSRSEERPPPKGRPGSEHLLNASQQITGIGYPNRRYASLNISSLKSGCHITENYICV